MCHWCPFPIKSVSAMSKNASASGESNLFELFRALSSSRRSLRERGFLFLLPEGESNPFWLLGLFETCKLGGRTKFRYVLNPCRERSECLSEAFRMTVGYVLTSRLPLLPCFRGIVGTGPGFNRKLGPMIRCQRAYWIVIS